MLSIKPGVKITGITPEMQLGNQIVNQVFNENDYECTITEIMPTVKHKRGSRHNTGNAIDYRIRHVSVKDRGMITKILITALGENYDVVPHRKHTHIEFDPK